MNKRVYRDTFAVSQLEFFKTPVIQEDMVDAIDNKDVLMHQVYTIDPVSKLPTGDLQFFMSSDTNPEIREFIAKNLMQPSARMPEDSKLSDDDIAALSRNPGESRSSYLSRIRGFLDDYKSYRESLKPKTE